MFCSQCGVKAGGKFCHNCGSPLQGQEAVLILQDQDFLPEDDDWENDARYERIVRVEAVRTAIAQRAAKATKGVSAEMIFGIYDKIVASPIPLASLAGVVQPLYASWGVRTGKERAGVIRAPIGRVIARTLCAFAMRSRTFQGAEQGELGCRLTATLPSSMCALEGALHVSLQRQENETLVAASTAIPGQMFDWGKSRRCLEQLFHDLNSDLGLPPGRQQRAA